jgi:predicted GNAT superfamily acetyltransferase
VARLCVELHGAGDARELAEALAGRKNIYLQIARLDGAAVGFKLGYQERPKYFESWRGGVIATARGRGIARAMMQAQHEWCASEGFKIIQTVCQAENQAMISLNLSMGFMVVGSYLDRGEVLKVILQKKV